MNTCMTTARVCDDAVMSTRSLRETEFQDWFAVAVFIHNLCLSYKLSWSPRCPLIHCVELSLSWCGWCLFMVYLVQKQRNRVFINIPESKFSWRWFSEVGDWSLLTMEVEFYLRDWTDFSAAKEENDGVTGIHCQLLSLSSISVYMLQLAGSHLCWK